MFCFCFNVFNCFTVTLNVLMLYINIRDHTQTTHWNCKGEPQRVNPRQQWRYIILYNQRHHRTRPCLLAHTHCQVNGHVAGLSSAIFCFFKLDLLVQCHESAAREAQKAVASSRVGILSSLSGQYQCITQCIDWIRLPPEDKLCAEICILLHYVMSA